VSTILKFIAYNQDLINLNEINMISEKSSEVLAFEKIQAKRSKPWKGEAEVRQVWIHALEEATGKDLDLERNKKDCSYNNVIIEFKAPGLFNASKTSPKFKEATQNRLLPYIIRESKKTGIPPEDYIGIAIDGDHICFAQVFNDCIQTQHLIPFSSFAVGLVIQAIKADIRKAISSDNLMADFGHGSMNAIALMQAMADALAGELEIKENSKVKMLFEEWKSLYGQVADMSILQSESIEKDISFSWNGYSNKSLPERLFSIHTYNSLLIKLLAAEIVSAYGLTSIPQPAQSMSAMMDDSELLDSLYRNIEKSEIFTQAGINGFVEEAIFSWYIDVARKPEYSESLLSSLRRILATLSLYRTDQVIHTRDVLRDLYQELVPGKLRQSLGEFYTPDWLVDFTISKAKKGSWLQSRVLDPTCGSGAFLLSAIRCVREEATLNNWCAKETLQYLCSSIWGFDLNPLAVQTARVNFLMEIADLLKATPGQQIEIPVLLADAIYSPAAVPEKGSEIVNYKIGSQFARLDIDLPGVLAIDRIRLDQVFAQMGESVEINLEFAEVGIRLTNSKIISTTELEQWRLPLKRTYDQILALHRQHWNGIWFRIVRNFFWSATAGYFDYIIGNPPWVRWSKLPDAYRERAKPTCEHYDIFSKNKRHGGNELDISAMITYTTADKWLKKDGRLAFVITGSIFKNPSSAGFRNFKLEPNNPNSLYLSPVSVDDMKELKPFADASNHTVVAVFNKSLTVGTYPVPYREWINKPHFPKTIASHLSLNSVLNQVEIIEKEAVPVGKMGSPWAVLQVGRYGLLQKMSGVCDWTSGRKGITADLNGVYFVPIIETSGNQVKIQSRPEAGKKDIGPTRTAWVESNLLYPLIKGAGDFETCYIRLTNPDLIATQLFTFVPNSGITSKEYKDCENLINSAELAKTKLWFSSFYNLLNDRSTYRRQMPGAPFYAVYNVGEYTFKKWKVVWPEMSSKFYAAVAGSAEVPGYGMRPFVPDHKIYFAAFNEKESAYFLCGLLNAPSVIEWIESHNIKIQVGDIFKHLILPKLDKNNNEHLTLIDLVEKAHQTHERKDRQQIINKVMAKSECIIKDWSGA
jgi:hypothetical protein